MSDAPLTRRDLDNRTCSGHECHHSAETGHAMVMASGCHPDADLNAVYHNGAIELTCGECGSYVVTIGVAP